MTMSFDATLWEYDGPSAWHFVSLPPDTADAVAELSSGRTGGFGSVRVEVTIGGSRWRTSVFPDARRGTYVLPIKKAVRTAEALSEGSRATITLHVLHAGPEQRGRGGNVGD